MKKQFQPNLVEMVENNIRIATIRVLIYSSTLRLRKEMSTRKYLLLICFITGFKRSSHT